MTSNRAKYYRPVTVQDALSRLTDLRETTAVLSGGTHVMSHFNRDWPRVSQLLDVSAIKDSATVSFMAEEAVLGTAVTYATVLSNAGARLPGLLRQIAGGITGGPQIRNQGTIGGSACYANPASDIPTGLVALDATMRCVSASQGERTLPASAFFRSAFVTALDPDEILVSIALAYDNPSERWGYVKLKTTESSWPVAVAAAKVCGGRVTVTIGASTEIPVTIGPFQLQNASRISADDAAVIRDRVRTTPASWWSDELSDATYRKRMAEVVAVRAVQDAFGREHTHE